MHTYVCHREEINAYADNFSSLSSDVFVKGLQQIMKMKAQC